MSKKAAIAILEQMMRELNEDNWPSEKTWIAARKMVGWKPMPVTLDKIDPGERIPLLKAITQSGRSFDPTGKLK